jgi:glutamate-1-semialdehyde 2,1-aminomutase
VGEYFGVTPDLAVFAKGVANGMPLSVYCGRKEVMAGFEKVVVTSTMGGETLSLAAAKAALATYRDCDVIGHLRTQGQRMWGGLNGLFGRHGIPAGMRGLWPCPQLVFEPDADKDLAERFFRAAYRSGVCLFGVGYVNFGHAGKDIDEALSRLEDALKQI